MASLAQLSSRSHARGRAVPTSLWIVQILLAALFVAAGLITLSQPTQTLAVHFPWTAYAGPAATRLVGGLELLGGLGLLLSAVTRRRRMAAVSAIAVGAVMFLGFAFHLTHFEYRTLPLDILLIALAGFLVWGRLRATV